MKQILTRKQVVAIFHQFDKNIYELDLFFPVDDKSKYFKLSNEEMEKKLQKYHKFNFEQISAIVDF